MMGHLARRMHSEIPPGFDPQGSLVCCFIGLQVSRVDLSSLRVEPTPGGLETGSSPDKARLEEGREKARVKPKVQARARLDESYESDQEFVHGQGTINFTAFFLFEERLCSCFQPISFLVLLFPPSPGSVLCYVTGPDNKN